MCALIMTPPGLQDRWDFVTSMREARSAFELAKLSDGRVLAVGGRGRGSSVLASTEVYDPASETWTAQGNMTFARASFALARLSDGRVLVAGGRGESSQMLNSSEVTIQSCRSCIPDRA